MLKKKILILTGSPRRNGNSDLMAEAFITGASDQGHEVVKFASGRKAIGGCNACKKCWSEGDPCIYRDDFDQLVPLLEAADVIVFCTPLYWFTFPVQILAPIDRMYAYLSDNSKRFLKIKECYLLVCGADEEDEIFDGITASYRAIANHMDWEDRGILTVTGVQDKGDIKATEALEKAEALGRLI